jgi:hypothetical protein
MKQGAGLALAAIVAVSAAGGGYWMGTRKGGDHGASVTPAQSAAAPASESKLRKLLYYRNPMGLPDTSPTPKKDPMGMDYIAVYEGEQERRTRCRQPDQDQHRQSSEARRQDRGREVALARPRRPRRRPH